MSVIIKPQDHRCRFWAKIIRAGVALPLPANVTSASDIPGAYCKNGDEELFAGDVLITGEENSHRKARGWTYRVEWMNEATGERRRAFPSSDIKAELKAGGLDAKLLAGSGDVAACIRIAQGLRAGIPFTAYTDAE